MVKEVEGMIASEGQLRQSPDLGDIPLAVLTADVEDDPMLSAKDNQNMRQIWMELQSELAALSTVSTHEVIKNTTHHIHLKQPKAVIEAIRQIALQEKSGQSL